MRTITVFDMDNTLIPNEYYDNAIDAFVELMQESLDYGMSEEQISSMQRKIDQKNFKKHGFKEDRFANSMVQAYEKLCWDIGAHPDNKIRAISFAIGMSVFDEERWRENDLLPGVEETLDFLLKQGHELYLLTEGLEKWQKKKIEVTSLKKWFNDEKNNYLCTETGKTPENLLGLIKRSSGTCDDAAYVGDKRTRDVRLALETGVLPIYIPERNSRDDEFFGENHEEPLDSRVIQLESIIELKENYKTVFQK